MRPQHLRVILFVTLSGTALLGLFALRSLQEPAERTTEPQAPTASLSNRTGQFPERPTAPVQDPFDGVREEAGSLERLLETLPR